MGGIQPLPPQERPQLTRLTARLRFSENPKLVGPWKPPPNRSLHHFRIGKRGKNPRKERISREKDSRGSPSSLLLFFRRLHNRYHLFLLHARFSFPPYSKLWGRKCLTHCGTEGLSLPEVGRRLSVAPSTIRYWVKAARSGRLKEVGSQQRPLTEIEMELYRVKRELAEVKMERDILKKAAAYFAKESLPGTRS
jgi:transposase